MKLGDLKCEILYRDKANTVCTKTVKVSEINILMDTSDKHLNPGCPVCGQKLGVLNTETFYCDRCSDYRRLFSRSYITGFWDGHNKGLKI